MSTPRVSVLMATYNAMPYLPAAVESILKQEMTDFEFVIVDDGSTDDSATYLDSLDDPRINLIRQENAGLSASLNTGLAACRAPYIARMDADDSCTTDRLGKQADYLDAHPEIGCLGSQTAPFGDVSVGKNLKLPMTHEELCLALEEGRHAFVHPSVMMRAEPIREIGGYWPMRVVAEDYDMFIRLSEVTRFATIDQVLYHMRFHMDSLNGSGMKRMRRAVDYARDRNVRRRQGMPEITFEQFCDNRQRAPWHQRITESIDAHARAQYRASMGDLCNARKLRGYARLGWAAMCAPQLTLERIARMFSRTVSH